MQASAGSWKACLHLWSRLRIPSMVGLGLNKPGFLRSHSITSPDPQPGPPAPGAEVRPAAQIPVAPVAVTGISTGNGRPELQGAWPSLLPAWLQFCLCKHLFFKNDFCCLADALSCSLSLSFHPAHLESSHLRKFLWTLISIDIWNWVKWSQERK